jgi:hypothetical protein
MAEGWYDRQACQTDGAFLGNFLLSDELKNLLVRVIASWQVLVVTGILIVYVFLVNYVARLYHRNRPFSRPGKKEKAAGAEAGAVEPSASDDLGLEEKSDKK